MAWPVPLAECRCRKIGASRCDQRQWPRQSAPPHGLVPCLFPPALQQGLQAQTREGGVGTGTTGADTARGLVWGSPIIRRRKRKSALGARQAAASHLHAFKHSQCRRFDHAHHLSRGRPPAAWSGRNLSDCCLRQSVSGESGFRATSWSDMCFRIFPPSVVGGVCEIRVRSGSTGTLVTSSLKWALSIRCGIVDTSHRPIGGNGI